MGVSSHDIFGGAAAPQPAAPGSYGEAPVAPLPAELRLGAVRLQVSDLARSRQWYETVLGLTPLATSSDAVELGVAGAHEPLVVLEHRPGTRAVRPGTRLGLYHFAILLPDRPALGRFVQHLSRFGARAGAADHLVSEALYLQDPDGLGIEVYRDRPRTEWQRIGRELMMATDPLDGPAIVASAAGAPWTGIPAGTVMGHLHLHVGDLGQARAFYSDAVGFHRMVWRYPGALFLAAGGYHHHLGTNTWAQGATPPGEQDARLLEWTAVLPTPADVQRVGERVALAGHAVNAEGDGVLLRDPWGTALRIRPATVG